MTRRNLLPALLVAIGVLWLLYQSGFVPRPAWLALASYWPILIIGIGLDLLGLRRPWSVPYTVLAAAILVVVTIIVPHPVPTGELTAFREPIGAARSASVQLELPSAASRVTAASEPDTLLDAQVQGRPTAVFQVQGEREKTVTVRPRRDGPWVPNPFGISRWQLALGTGVPLDLTIKGGSGSATLVLTALQLTALQAELGSGPVTLSLPGSGQSYRAQVDGGSGPSQIRLAPGASLELTLATGSGSTDLTVLPGADARISLRAGSGPVSLDVPNDAPVRLEVRDDGSGPLTVASFLERRSGTGDTGTWQSASYRDGGRAVLITVVDAGSGPISVR